jgi:hypothetical protein
MNALDRLPVTDRGRSRERAGARKTSLSPGFRMRTPADTVRVRHIMDGWR